MDLQGSCSKKFTPQTLLIFKPCTSLISVIECIFTRQHKPIRGLNSQLIIYDDMAFFPYGRP
jgi:hypothetical protein